MSALNGRWAGLARALQYQVMHPIEWHVSPDQGHAYYFFGGLVMNCNTRNGNVAVRSANVPAVVAQSLLSDPFFAPFFGTSFAAPRVRSADSLPLDISETPTHTVLRASLPGFAREQVQVEVEDRVLTITATRESASESSDETMIRRERYSGTVARSLALPETLDPDSVDAELKDGVLTLRLAKIAPEKGRKIEIR
jgi:HSP20 family molecular chaperone IbpA